MTMVEKRSYTPAMSSRGGEETQPGMIESIEGREIKPFPVRTPSSSAHSIYGYIYKRQLGTEAAQYNIK